MMMRLDKFLTHTGTLSRRDAGKAAKSGKISVNGVPVRAQDARIDPETDTVMYNGKVIEYRKYTYIMLNKPDGYISATDDPRQTTVLELLPENLRRIGLFPCGRLDKDTLGLLILTNDGDTAHKNLSPKHHAEKEYRYGLASDLSDSVRAEMEFGVTLDDGYKTLPCKICAEGERGGVITLTEGKYHQIKRMFEAYGNKIIYLERISFAGITLDPALARGEWRFLTPEEEERIKNND